MRSLKSGLFAIALAGLFGTVAVVGCSANGDGTIDNSVASTEPTAADPGSSGGAVLPPSSNDPGTVPDSGSTSTKKDGGVKTEAGVDAGPPPPVEGAACTTLNQIASKPCGACGKSETVCLDDGSGKGKWSPYGTCGSELVGGCVPGTTVNAVCGNCGTQVKTCTQYCAYTISTCTGQPANSCVPGAVEYTSAGCTDPSTYRNHTCGATCTFGGYSASCVEPINANKMTISATAGGLVTQQWTLAPTSVGKKVTGTCGAAASVSSTADYPTVIVEVKNPNATQQATIQIYHSGTGTPLDTLIWVYKSTLPATTDATFSACDFGSADECITGDPCGNSAGGGSAFDFAGIDGVTIPAGGKILVYSAGYLQGVVGNFNLNLKTVKFGP